MAKDIAAAYGVHIQTVYRWEREGLLPEPAKAFGWKRWERDAVVKHFARKGIVPIETAEPD